MAKAENDLLLEARKRFKQAREAEGTLRANQLEDARFAAGEHWPEGIKADRKSDGRPALTIDRLTPQLKQVTNQQREMRPAIEVVAVDSGSDPNTAEVFQGIIRHIETQSDADDAYDQAGRDQVTIGRGWFRVLTDYVDDRSLDQEIRIAAIRNPFSVYIDPSAVKRDYSDARYAFVVVDLTEDEFSARYPKAKHASLEEFKSKGDEIAGWMNSSGVGHIRVAEYWRVNTTSASIDVQGADGEAVSRTIEQRTVTCDTISALEVLEHCDWAGKYIPLVPVLGEVVDLEGVVDYRGMVRRAKDPQRMFNYWRSAATEMIALAPRAPFIVAEGQLENYEKAWGVANTRNQPYLQYKPVTLGGSLAPPPQRQAIEPPIQALMVSSQAAEADLRAITGFYDAAPDQPEISGRAILARQQQGQHGNSDFLDGLARAIRFAGRILIDLIPKIYDTQRVLRIIGADNQPQTVMVHAGNPPTVGPDGQPMLPPGVSGVFDLSAGVYDVVVEAGPNYRTAREQFVAQMGEIFQSQPQLFPLLGDLYFENVDLPNASQIVDRLKKMLPPQLQDGSAAGNVPPQVQGQIQQLTQTVQMQGQQLQQAQQIIQGKQLELQAQSQIKAAEIASKERIAQLQAEVDKLKIASDAQLAQLKLQAETAHAVIENSAKPAPVAHVDA